MDIVIDTSQVMQLAELWRRAPDITREEMLRTVTECDLLVQGELQQELPRGVGGQHGAGLAGTIFREEHALADNVLGLVATKEPYAEYIEVGTKPHWVNKAGIQSLMDWVSLKLGYHDEEAEGVAHAIAWKIHHYGTEADPVWQRTYVKLLGLIQVKFGDAVVRITQRLAPGAA